MVFAFLVKTEKNNLAGLPHQFIYLDLPAPLSDAAAAFT